MVCLGNEWRSFCHCWDCTQVLHFGLFCWLWVWLHFSKRFSPTLVDIMVIWIKFTHPVLIRSLIPKLSGFTLAISYLSTSNLPWFMDLTFQVPMQYYSLQHQTLFSPPATTGHCFHFGSTSSFLLELFLHSSPVPYWTPTNLEVQPFCVIYFCFFILFMCSQGKNNAVVCHSVLQWTMFCQNSPSWPVHFGWPYMAWRIVSLS